MYPYKRQTGARQNKAPAGAVPFRGFMEDSRHGRFLRKMDLTGRPSEEGGESGDAEEGVLPGGENNGEGSEFIVQMLIEAIKDETADAAFYEDISNLLEDDGDAKAFYKISCDEKKHMKIFTEIYAALTGEEPSESDIMTDRKNVCENLADNFSDAIFDELSAFEFYRKLYFAFLNVELRDAIFEIMTDKQSHAQILNYMYAKYK